MKHIYLLFLSLLPCTIMAQERLRIVEWNVENLFDTEHDSEKNDLEFTPKLATPLDTHKILGEAEQSRTRHYLVWRGFCKNLSARLNRIVRSGERQHNDLPY